MGVPPNAPCDKQGQHKGAQEKFDRAVEVANGMLGLDGNAVYVASMRSC